jgi:hypothetical protein
MGNMQAVGHGLHAGQFDDLGTLQGGESRSDVPTAWPIREGRITRGVHSDGRCDGRSIHHTGSGKPVFASELHPLSPRGCVPAGLETKAGSGCAQFVEGPVSRRKRSRSDAGFGHAWGKLLAEKRHPVQHSSRLEFRALLMAGDTSVAGQKNCTKFRSHDVRTTVSSYGSSMSTRTGGRRGGCTLATRP